MSQILDSKKIDLKCVWNALIILCFNAMRGAKVLGRVGTGIFSDFTTHLVIEQAYCTISFQNWAATCSKISELRYFAVALRCFLGFLYNFWTERSPSSSRSEEPEHAGSNRGSSSSVPSISSSVSLSNSLTVAGSCQTLEPNALQDCLRDVSRNATYHNVALRNASQCRVT